MWISGCRRSSILAPALWCVSCGSQRLTHRVPSCIGTAMHAAHSLRAPCIRACGGMQGGRDVHKGGVAGFGSGEGQSAGAATRHRVRIVNHHADQEVEVDVPEDRCGSQDPIDSCIAALPSCRLAFTLHTLCMNVSKWHAEPQ